MLRNTSQQSKSKFQVVGQGQTSHATGTALQASPAPDVEFVLPAHNEERRIGLAVTLLKQWLHGNAQFGWRVTVADCASTDQTLAIASRMQRKDPTHVGVVHLDEKGHGRALKRAWLASDARVVAYMDVDLSTDLDAIQALVTPLLAGSADVAYGSRLSRGSRTTRCLTRELMSRCYNLLLNLAFSYHVSDAPCGVRRMRAAICSHRLGAQIASVLPGAACYASPSSTVRISC